MRGSSHLRTSVAILVRCSANVYKSKGIIVEKTPLSLSSIEHSDPPLSPNPLALATKQDVLTELPLVKAVARLAWPAMASMLLLNIFQLVDAFWVGRLGTGSLGGMSASAFFVWCLNSIGMLAGTGVTALVARRVGERDLARAAVVGGHGLLLALTLGLVTLLIVLPFSGTLLGLLGLDAPVKAAANAYLTPFLFGMPVITCLYAIEALFRGSGDTKTPMWILGGTLLFNAALDPLMIFGLGPFPAMGIAGAAWATIIAHACGLGIALGLLRKRAVRPRLGTFDSKLVGSLIKIGAPIAAGNFLFCVIYIFLTPIIAAHGSAAVAAIGVGHRIEGLAYFACVGFASAAATLVGQHLGANQPDKAERAAWLSALCAGGLVLAFSAIYFTLAAPIFGIFADDAAVVSTGSSYLRIIALFETAMALEVVLEGAFSGAGNSLPPMLISAPLTALRIPVAFYLGKRYGVDAIWWVISVSTLLKGLTMATWFRLGRWKRTTI